MYLLASTKLKTSNSSQQYLTILDNIGKYLTASMCKNIVLYQAILKVSHLVPQKQRNANAIFSVPFPFLHEQVLEELSLLNPN